MSWCASVVMLVSRSNNVSKLRFAITLGVRTTGPGIFAHFLFLSHKGVKTQNEIYSLSLFFIFSFKEKNKNKKIKFKAYFIMVKCVAPRLSLHETFLF